MFDDINALEKEIADFRQNILASNDLVKRLEDLTAGIRSQTRSFESASNAIQSSMEGQAASLKQVAEEALSRQVLQLAQTGQSQLASVVEQISALNLQHVRALNDTEANMRAFTEEANAQKENLLRATEAVQRVMETEINFLRKDLGDAVTKQTDRLIQNSQAQMTDAVQTISEKQKAFVALMDESEQRIKKRQDALDEKYKTLLNKLESANLEEIIKLTKKAIRTMNIWFGVLFAGVGAAVALAVYALLR